MVRTGCYRDQAAQGGGIGPSTLYEWIRRGEAETRGRYRDFADALRQAEAQWEAILLARIAKAAERGDGKPPAFVLERRAPERWGPNRSDPPPPPPTAGRLDLSRLSTAELA